MQKLICAQLASRNFSKSAKIKLTEGGKEVGAGLLTINGGYCEGTSASDS